MLTYCLLPTVGFFHDIRIHWRCIPHFVLHSGFLALYLLAFCFYTSLAPWLHRIASHRIGISIALNHNPGVGNGNHCSIWYSTLASIDILRVVGAAGDHESSCFAHEHEHDTSHFGLFLRFLFFLVCAECGNGREMNMHNFL